MKAVKPNFMMALSHASQPKNKAERIVKYESK